MFACSESALVDTNDTFIVQLIKSDASQFEIMILVTRVAIGIVCWQKLLRMKSIIDGLENVSLFDKGWCTVLVLS